MHRFARVVAAATLVLIFAGGLVKSTETGLSDRTWPHFNGGYEPSLRGETRFEHPHRLIAGTVVLLTIGLAVAAARGEPRRWVRALAWGASVAGLLQAVFGGLTVLLELKSLGISLAHAGLGQLFFGLVVTLAVVTSEAWTSSATSASTSTSTTTGWSLGALATLTAAAVYVQILLGAWVRYTPGAAYAIPDFPLAYGRLIPPTLYLEPIYVQFIHRAGAAVVALLALAVAWRVFRRHPGEPRLRRPAALLLAALAAQVLLGGATIWSVKGVVWATLHVAAGAALFATAVVLALFAWRLSLRNAGSEESRNSCIPGFLVSSERSPRFGLARDLATLTRARIALLVTISAAAGFHLGSPGEVRFGLLAATLLGTGLLGAGAAALNQVVERDADARMRRTADRPIPAGRMSVGTATAIGLGLGVAGFVLLLVLVNPLTAWIGAATLVAYVAIYTPLKRVTWTATIVGAVPGALPPVMGFAGAAGAVPFEAWILFAIIFFWQIPHFFAIAWLYRDDYARGGFPMLPVVDEGGHATARQVTFCCLALLSLSLLPTVYGLAGRGYLFGAIALGTAFLALGVALATSRSEGSARRLFLGSVVYLPVLLFLLAFDRVA